MAEPVENKSGAVSDSPETRPTGRVLLDSASEGVLSVAGFLAGFLAWIVRWSFAVIFLIIVMAASAYFVFNEAVKGGGYIVVPDVVGLPLNKASNILVESGLEIGKQRQVVNDRYPEYHVMLQRPAANRVVRSGRKVHLTISAGTRFEAAPYLVGRNLETAKHDLESTRLRLGSVARIPDNADRDVVLAQDPPSGRNVAAGAEVHVLVSAGPAVRQIFMPNLVGKTVDQAMAMLAGIGLQAVPYHVDRAGAEYDVVLGQSLKAGTLLQEGQTVDFDVRLLQSTRLPETRRRVSLPYTVPSHPDRVQLRVDIVDKKGDRVTVYPLPRDYINGKPPLLRAGTRMTIPFSYFEEATVEFYLDGVHRTSYYYKGNADPEIQEFATPSAVRGRFRDRNDSAKPKRRRFQFLPR
ncbi:MAG: PASTA domain-containing protein [Candidatus Hydrogenedentes bacterium]|nr:PASTA domain-containing protein [Candidatus Hydrogenedentota bacterium]